MFGLTTSLLFQNPVLDQIAAHGFWSWIFVGMLAGWVAGKVTRGRSYGCITNIVLGLIGAVVGGWLCTKIGIVALGFWGSVGAATAGAVLLVALARLIFDGGPKEP